MTSEYSSNRNTTMMMEEEEEDIDFSDLNEEYSVTYSSPIDRVIILDGAPIVGSDRSDKLIQVIIKATKKETGISLTNQQISMEIDSESLKSKGFLFISFENNNQIEIFKRVFHNYQFDKKHTFTCIQANQINHYNNLDDQFQQPIKDKWFPREHFRQWLADGRDQLMLYRDEETQIAWNTKSKPASDIAFERTKWTDSYTQWSPHGTFLATIHGPGVALWGGASFNAVNRFAHAEVQLIDFSPFERYLVTWSAKPIEVDTRRGPSPFTAEDEGNSIAVWEVMTGRLLRTFPMIVEPLTEEQKKSAPPAPARRSIVWPMFKWSPDEKFVGRVTPGQQISIYEVPSMGLLGKKSLKIEGVRDFEWCPLNDKERDELEAEAMGKPKVGKPGPARENIIAFWTPEMQNQPARVTLMSLPSRIPIRSKNLFNVHDCKIHWQSNGDYLCVKVDRHTKTKKTQYCNLELFRLRDKDCPVQVIEIKDAVTAFGWEPKGERFVLITTNDPNHGQVAPGVLLKSSVSFYGFDARKGDFLQLKTFDNKTSNSVFWSPKGRHVLVATLGSNSKFDIEFWDLDLDREGSADKTEEKDAGGAIRLITTVEHYGLTQIEWDPSGRYVATSASTWQSSMESGYALWDFKGGELQKHTQDKFKQLLWRPRPPTLLSKEDQKRIRKNLRDYSRAFDEADELEESNVSAELIALRKRLIEEWNSWRGHSKENMERNRIDQGKAPKESLVRSQQALVAEEVIEEWQEVIISETTELITA